MAARTSVRFFLNGKEVECAVKPETALLDYIRDDRELTGTKEGCGEGDCGACTVVIGEVKDGRVRYHATVSCLALVAQMDGKHVITIEGMSPAGKGLHPIQQAIVDAHATQCGFCTPGIALALLALYLENSAPTPEDVHRALSGNLCRCTGYVSIRRVPDFIHRLDVKAADIRLPFLDDVEARMLARSRSPEASDDILIERDGETFFSPATTGSLKDFLKAHRGMKVQYVGGGSDVMVVVRKRFVHPPCLVDLTRLADLHGIKVDGDSVTFGACVSLEELGSETLAALPAIDSVVGRMASKPVRNTATVAGNIVNASPVADMSCLLMALDATLRLDGVDGRRDVRLEGFYQGYKKMDLKPGEWVQGISVPRGGWTHVNFEKASKRKELDISSVNSALAVEVKEGVIRKARLCCGGVGPTTMFMARTSSAFLEGKPFAEDTFVQAAEVIAGEATPMSDVRGSAEYRRAVMKNLVIKHYLSIQERNGQPSGK